MPRLRESYEDAELHRFCDWVRGSARRKSITQRDISDELQISEVSLSNKLNGKTRLTAKDIIQMCEILGAYTFGTEA